MTSCSRCTKPERACGGEQHRAGDDQRVLVFLADLLPEVDVGEDALERLEILLVADMLRLARLRRVLAACGRRPAPRAPAMRMVLPASPSRWIPIRRRSIRRRSSRCQRARRCRALCRPAARWPVPAAAARRRRSRGARTSSGAGCAAGERSRGWRPRPRSRRRGSRRSSTRWNGVTSIFGWMGVSIGTSYEVRARAHGEREREASDCRGGSCGH